MELHTILDIISIIALIASFCYFLEGIIISGLIALYISCMFMGATCDARAWERGENV